MKAWLAALVLLWVGQASADSWRFGLIGDVPYSEAERRELPQMLAAMADDKVDFIIHVGDFKHGKDRCDDAVFEDRRALFEAARVPFVFVPGDNEWTDCERLSNGAYDPLERLEKLRSLFFSKPQSLGQKKLALERQPGPYPEHSRFRVGPLLFVMLNLPGGNNNYGLTGEASREFRNRNPYVLAWLKDSFALARQDKLAGIALLFQANPGFKHHAQGFAHSGYREFLDTLREETLAFSGQVLVVHGDTHTSRVDQPMRDKMGRVVSNFVRVETFGYPTMGWTSGSIDRESPTRIRFDRHPWPPAGAQPAP